MYETLEIEIKSAVATIWMNRPAVHNAFNAGVIAELTSACHRLGADTSLRVIVLAGRGKSFSAGGDLNWMRETAEADLASNQEDARKLAIMLRTLAEVSKPTIARVHGAALGGGMGLVSACDICIASPDASFATSEVRLGLIPAAISPYVVRAIGQRQAYRYFQTAERISAERAVQLGLVHELVAPEHLDAKVQEIVDVLLLGGQAAQSAAKDLIRAVAERGMDDAVVEDTAQRIATLRTQAEAKEGISAFLGKRKPEWADLSLNGFSAAVAPGSSTGRGNS